MRSYAVRHGKGPMPTEDLTLQFSEPHNSFNEWQGEFRQGWLDFPLLKYAIDVCGGVDYLVVSHLDCINNISQIPYCYRHEESFDQLLTKSNLKGNLLYRRQALLTSMLEKCKPCYNFVDTSEFCDIIETQLNKKIAIKSFGPSHENKKMITEL